ncbi:long-chain fatty acid--CoA ligase [Planosporangium flavigriseum]|uniref:Long-chain acyl-CoA synthetase n=1 Tax=Planosporangium flavigriseum TaxID=373681 RepID=A0A8J3LGH0_9ACTN|nr:AMP-dependent synthetase/ligase [Planosporangium flavigriseum]NJC63278.1 long-chain fatty acid--CoA ligase [Planosporangium flavigriseum]GIG72552.1 long-chain acyl-CoA synthetase [Planosporangium flavigriseum]
MREFSVPPVAIIDDSATLTDPVWENAAVAPDDVQFARRVEGQWQDVTCGQFRNEVVALAQGLIAAGVQVGDRVGLMSRTRYEWTLIDYAIWAAGAVTVPIYETSSAEQVAWILSDSGAVGCFVETDAHRATVEQVRDQFPAMAHLWTIDAGAVSELVTGGSGVPADEVERRRKAVGADDIATIIYTSGTTGRPKGCLLTHRNLYFDIANSVPKLRSLFRENSSTLLFLPLAHSFARIIQAGCVLARARMGHTADVKNLVADLQSFQPTFILSVPRVFEKVYNTAAQKAQADGKGSIFARAERVAIAYSESLDAGGPGLLLRAQHALFNKLVYGKLRAALGGRCGHAISGGAPLGTRLAHFYRGIGLDVREGYGLTETSPVVAANFDDGVRLGTVGRPVPGTTVRVADDGEILVKGDQVFKGYWNNEAATAEALDADGWFRTGDLGDLDDDGFLRITGRKKELIVTAGGKNVAPAVLEDRLRGHVLVSQCMVVGDRQPFIAALVTIDEEALPAWKAEHGKPADAGVADLRDDEQLRATIQEAVNYANQAVSKAEAIKQFRILPRDFTDATGELTPSLKVKRNVVMKQYADEIAAIYGG